MRLDLSLCQFFLFELKITIYIWWVKKIVYLRNMMGCNKFVKMFLNGRTIFFALFLSSCADGPPKLPLPDYMVVAIPDSTEVSLCDFVATHSLTGLFYVNGDCSPCLIELNGWQHFFANYPELSPLLVVRTEYPSTFPIVLDVNGFTFPTLYDYDLTLWGRNNFASFARLIVLNREAGILYAGNPSIDNSFTNKYNSWIIQWLDDNK